MLSKSSNVPELPCTVKFPSNIKKSELSLLANKFVTSAGLKLRIVFSGGAGVGKTTLSTALFEEMMTTSSRHIKESFNCDLMKDIGANFQVLRQISWLGEYIKSWKTKNPRPRLSFTEKEDDIIIADRHPLAAYTYCRNEILYDTCLHMIKTLMARKDLFTIVIIVTCNEEERLERVKRRTEINKDILRKETDMKLVREFEHKFISYMDMFDKMGMLSFTFSNNKPLEHSISKMIETIKMILKMKMKGKSNKRIKSKIRKLDI